MAEAGRPDHCAARPERGLVQFTHEGAGAAGGQKHVEQSSSNLVLGDSHDIARRLSPSALRAVVLRVVHAAGVSKRQQNNAIEASRRCEVLSFGQSLRGCGTFTKTTMPPEWPDLDLLWSRE
jgi:hypothetical protein